MSDKDYINYRIEPGDLVIYKNYRPEFLHLFEVTWIGATDCGVRLWIIDKRVSRLPIGTGFTFLTKYVRLPTPLETIALAAL